MKTYKTLISNISLKATKSDFKKVKILSSEDAAKYARQFYYDDLNIYESVFIILLNRANNTIGYAKISQGGLCGSVIDIRLVAKYALECLATGVIMVHNHPSGNIEPSTADRRVTERIKNGLKTLDISLLDHIILAEAEYYGFVDNGEL